MCPCHASPTPQKNRLIRGLWRLVFLCFFALIPTLGCFHRPFVFDGDLRADAHTAVDGRLDANAHLDGQVNSRADVAVSGELKAAGAVETKVDFEKPKRPMQLKDLPGASSTEASSRFIAVIDVDGILLDANPTGLGSRGENPVEAFRERLDFLAHDDRLVAVVIRIHSPGGSVTATDIMSRDLKRFREQSGRPVVACLMDVATGGAYYLACGSDTIVAHPTSVVGGIGCILNVYNLQDLLAQFNIVNVAIKSGAKIDLGSPVRELNEENRKLLQDMTDEFHERFKSVVTRARPKVNADDEKLFDGRVFTASQAYNEKLIDTIGYLDDAVKLARKLGNAPDAPIKFLRREGDDPMSPYSITANTPLQDKLLPLQVPGLDRSRLPSFLYMWMVEPSADKLFGQ